MIGLPKLFGFLLFLMIDPAAISYAQVKSELSNSEITEQINKIIQSTNWTNDAEAKAAGLKIEALTRLLGQNPEKPDTIIPSGASAQDSAILNEDALQDRLFKIALDAFDAKATDAENLSVDLSAPVRNEIIREYKEDKMDSYVLTQADMPHLVVIDFNEESSVQELSVMLQNPNVRDLVLLYGPYANQFGLENLLDTICKLPLKTLVISGFHVITPEEAHTLPLVLPKFPELEVFYWIKNGKREFSPIATSTPILKEFYLDSYPSTGLTGILEGLKSLSVFGYSGMSLDVHQINVLKTLFPHCKFVIN